MPCYPVVIRQKVRRPIDLPSEQELRDDLGAMNHDDLHRLLSKMTAEEIVEAIERIRRKAKRKREEATYAYITESVRA